MKKVRLQRGTHLEATGIIHETDRKAPVSLLGR
jgi:hypothetical protein